MAKKKYKLNILSASSVNTLISDLSAYQSDLQTKCQTMVQELARRGIETARLNVGDYGRYLSFYTSLEPETYGCKGVLVATATGMIKSEWQTLEGIKSVDVNPLLMAEFGSGFKAKNPKGVAGVGQGTFPDQTHAFDQEGWYWQDLEGTWHHSYGVEPTQPVYKAWERMLLDIDSVKKEVFG